MGKDRYHVLKSIAPEGSIVILEEGQSLGSPPDPLALLVFSKHCHFILTGDAAQVVGGTSPGCAEVWNFRAYHLAGIRLPILQTHAISLDAMDAKIYASYLV